MHVFLSSHLSQNSGVLKTGIQIATIPIKHWEDTTQLQLHMSNNKSKQKKASVLVAQEQQHDYGQKERVIGLLLSYIVEIGISDYSS